jgi:hypothetical protein
MNKVKPFLSDSSCNNTKFSSLPPNPKSVNSQICNCRSFHFISCLLLFVIRIDMDNNKFDHFNTPAKGGKASTGVKEPKRRSPSRESKVPGNYSANVHHSSPGLSSIKANSTLNHSLLVGYADDTQEKQLLENRIDELKSRIASLEEQLFRYKEKELTQKRSAKETNTEIADLKLQLEEQNLELEERSLLLVKAKNAMEIMRKELINHQFTAQKQIELERKLHSLKEMNEEVEKEYKSQLFSYEQEVKNLQQKLSRKDQDLTMLEDQFVSNFLIVLSDSIHFL